MTRGGAAKVRPLAGRGALRSSRAQSFGALTGFAELDQYWL
jgi:hypothetical protein